MAVEASCFTALLTWTKGWSVISSLVNFRLGWTNKYFRPQEFESEFDHERPRPLLIPSRSHIGTADRYTKRIYSLRLVRGGFRKCRCRLAALHRSDSIEKLVEGSERGGLIFSTARTIEDDTAAIPGVVRSFVWSFVTAVRLDSTERLLSSSRTAEKVR